jgi:hypothetical protein
MKMQSLVALAAIAALLRTAALAQELPDVFHVADKVATHVEFQDEVKAVSYSQSTRGYYLSFGAPYPAQVVSVWVPAEIYEQLPGRRALVGRIARIKGLLEKSPSGALVRLEAREQFQLLQTDEAVLAKPALDGKMDRDQFKAAIRQHFSRAEFETLETLAEELRQSRERFSDGTWLSDAYFSAFAIAADASPDRYAAFEQKLGNWETARPGSLVLVIVRAGFHRDRAWHLMNRRDEGKVTAEGRESFRRELSIARQILESHPAAKMYPEYFSVMQSIAFGQRWPKDEYFRLFAEATSVERDYYAFYFKAAAYLLPRWSGKKGEWEEFAEQRRRERGVGVEGDALYARIAWSMKDNYRNLFRDTAVSWEAMASGFEYLMKQFPDSRYLKNAYANFAWKAGDRVRLRKLLAEIRNDPDMNIWVNLENLGMAEKVAATRAER